MAENAQQLRREECRRMVLDYLAARLVVAMRVPAIRRGLEREEAADFTDEEIEAALVFLQGAGLVEGAPGALSATKVWRITSPGVLQSERGGL